MRVCFICNEYPALGPCGGIGKLTEYMADALVKAGHSVLVVGVYKSFRSKQVKEMEGVKVIGLPYLRIPKLHWEWNRRRLMRLIEKENKLKKIDILEAPDYQGWLRVCKVSCPKIVRLHTPEKVGFDNSVDPNNLTRSLRSEQTTIMHADFVLSSSKSVGEAARKTYLDVQDKLFQMDNIYNGIDIQRFPLSPKDKIDKNKVVFAGRLTQKKGVFELIKAWSIVIQKFPNARLFLAGKDANDTNGSTKVQLLDILKEYGLTETVEFLGFINEREIKALFESANLCVFPSYREAFSAVIMEAMAMGKAVVYSKIPPGFEIIDHEKNGILIEPGNIEELGAAICSVMADTTLRDKLGIAARKKIEENFNIDKVKQLNLSYYQKCINMKNQ